MITVIKLRGFTQKGEYEGPSNGRVTLYPHDLSYGAVGRVFFPNNIFAISVPAETDEYRILPRKFKNSLNVASVTAIGGFSGLGVFFAGHLTWLPVFGPIFPSKVIPAVLSSLLFIMIFATELFQTAHSNKVLAEVVKDIEYVPLRLVFFDSSLRHRIKVAISTIFFLIITIFFIVFSIVNPISIIFWAIINLLAAFLVRLTFFPFATFAPTLKIELKR